MIPRFAVSSIVESVNSDYRGKETTMTAARFV
jgi:hypothetical protein